MRSGNSLAKIKKNIRFKRAVANIISVLFHPLLMPSYLFAVVGLFAPSLLSHLAVMQLMMLVFITTFLLPVCLVGITLGFSNKSLSLSTFLLENRKSRIIPFFITLLFYAAII